MRRTYMPIGGVARLRAHSGKPSQEFLIAVAGPLVNVGIAIALMALTLRHLSAEHFVAMERLKVSMIDRLADINLFLAVFNMVPA